MGLVDNWLRHIRDTYSKHSNELSSIKDKNKLFSRLCVLNVKEQVLKVRNTTIVQDAWLRENH